MSKFLWEVLLFYKNILVNNNNNNRISPDGSTKQRRKNQSYQGEDRYDATKQQM